MEVFATTLIKNKSIHEHSPSPEITFRLWILNVASIALKSARKSGSTVSKDIREMFYTIEELGGSEDDPSPVRVFSVECAKALASELAETEEGDLLKEMARVSILYYDALSCISPCKIFATRGGFLGNGPSSLWFGDAVWAIPGAGTPVVLRKTGTEGRYRLVGPTYLHGFMDGEAWQLMERGSLDVEEFILV
jgi:hypothetical protein